MSHIKQLFIVHFTNVLKQCKKQGGGGGGDFMFLYSYDIDGIKKDIFVLFDLDGSRQRTVEIDLLWRNYNNIPKKIQIRPNHLISSIERVSNLSTRQI